MNIVTAAARLAAATFAGQNRRVNGKPAITHMSELAGLVATRPWSRDAHVAAAFTHDNDEDDRTGLYGLVTIRAQLSDEVAEMVRWLTKPSSRPENAGLSKDAKLALDMAFIRTAPNDIKSIKAIDRFLNVSDMARDRSDREKAKAYLAETVILLEALEGAEPYCLDLVRSAMIPLQAFVDGQAAA